MRSLILFVSAVLMTACSSTKSKNFPAIKPVASIAKGTEVPLQQELEGSTPRKTVMGAWYDGDLNLFLLCSGVFILDYREAVYEGAVRVTHSTVMPEYGVTLNEVIERGWVRLFWVNGRMEAKFRPPNRKL